MEEPEAKRRGLFSSLRRLLSILGAIATNRVELLLVEWHEERLRLVGTLLLVGLLLVLVLMTLMTITMVLVAYCVVNDHLGAAGGLLLIYLVATVICYWRLRHRLKQWTPFAATLAELKKDKECWEEKS